MEELEIKSELKCEGENHVFDTSEMPESPDNLDDTQEIIQDVAVKKKKPKMEIELDFSLVKNEYYKPRERRAVKRYDDILLQEAENKRNKLEKQMNSKKNDKLSDEDLFCEVCHQQFQELKTLKIHRHAKHFKVSKFTCALCSATFDSNAELIKHKLLHKDEDRNFLCMKCKTAFSDHLEYLKHIAKHQKSSNYYCIECGREFDYRKGYNLHIEQHYYRIVECEICQHKCNWNRLKDHMNIHKGIKKLKCVECGKEYDKKAMQCHMTTHTGVKPFQCLYCGKGFGSQVIKNIHTRIHTGEKPYKCKVCYRGFTQHTDLIRHMESHNAAGSENTYNCEVCGKNFKHKESLRYHMDIHNNTQKYACNLCDYKNHTNTGLRSHILRNHTEGKKFKCIPCDVAFKTPSDLKKHQKLKKHKNNQYGYEQRIKKENE